jgi:hypothetical protein
LKRVTPPDKTRLRITTGEASTIVVPAGVHLIGGRNAAEKNRTLATEFYAPIVPAVVELRRQGLSLRQIVAELERRENPYQKWVEPPARTAGGADPGPCPRGRR